MSKIVVKIGSSSLSHEKRLSRSLMSSLARQIARLLTEGHHVALVSSGAILAGREVLNLYREKESVPLKQSLAAVGQIHLIQLWQEIFRNLSVNVGQILLTYGDFSKRQNYLNTRETLSSLLSLGILPIINENDTVATDEIKVGDNDNLSALVSTLMGADLLILLTDQEGLFTANPRIDRTASLIENVDAITDALLQSSKGSSSAVGVGGMYTKVLAAKQATESGVKVVIAQAKTPDVLMKILSGEKLGTHFHTQLTPKESRKRWLLAKRGLKKIIIDKGAEDKIVRGGASLLPSGVRQVEHPFIRGDVVAIFSAEGVKLGVGIVEYGSEEVEKIKSRHTKEIAQILGYNYGSEIIHRDNMAII
jgi:glutamate 5-kinase